MLLGRPTNACACLPSSTTTSSTIPHHPRLLHSQEDGQPQRDKVRGLHYPGAHVIDRIDDQLPQLPLTLSSRRPYHKPEHPPHHSVQHSTDSIAEREK